MILKSFYQYVCGAIQFIFRFLSFFYEKCKFLWFLCMFDDFLCIFIYFYHFFMKTATTAAADEFSWRIQPPSTRAGITYPVRIIPHSDNINAINMLEMEWSLMKICWLWCNLIWVCLLCLYPLYPLYYIWE